MGLLNIIRGMYLMKSCRSRHLYHFSSRLGLRSETSGTTLCQHGLVGASSSMLSKGKAQDQTGRAFDAFTAP
jgi:hypothetical protein